MDGMPLAIDISGLSGRIVSILSLPRGMLPSGNLPQLVERHVSSTGKRAVNHTNVE
jgi:hypothetical protein